MPHDTGGRCVTLPTVMQRVGDQAWRWGWMVLALWGTALAARAEATAWRPAAGPLNTRWTAQVGPTNALPEYPRPQLVRSDWLNLNGLWAYAITDATNSPPTVYSGQILVPFPLESALSGVMRRLEGNSLLWYRRLIVVPAGWRGRRVRLHFQAVDWLARVFINGLPVGQHRGGYDSFGFDITDQLHWDGTDEIVVAVSDPTEGDQPRGKQSRKTEGVFYTPTSGIWQTVWLEPVPPVCVDQLRLIPEADQQSLRLRVGVNSLDENFNFEAVATLDGKEIGRMTGPANTELVLPLASLRLWTPEDPFLYGLQIMLREGNRVIERVSSYFGMRKVGLQKDSQGVMRIALNGHPVFQIGTLDQGFWPDGIYTAPTDEALRSDIEFLKQAGFNLVRKHVKVEPERWYYWCDKLGLLVWQDMPSGNNATPEGRREFEAELFHMVTGLENHPSIIAWVLFNEGWGQFDTERLTRQLQRWDPTRLVNNASGWTDMRVGDMIDVHSYPGPDCPIPESRRAAVLGEFGGLGLAVDGHSWSSRSWGYLMLTNSTDLTRRYLRAFKQIWALHRFRGLDAAVYTQTTDVETECNGLLSYDRAVVKIDPSVLRAANRGEFPGPPMKVILPDAILGLAKWKYTTKDPGEAWIRPDFDASAWWEGFGGFATEGTPGAYPHTVWKTSDIWLRREFTLAANEAAGLKLHVYHDEDATIYLNGVLAAKLPGYIADYDEVDISAEAAAALRPGKNVIAVHCHQTTGGQGIDVGILVPLADKQSRHEKTERPRP